MSGFSQNHDVGARVKGFNAFNPIVVTATSARATESNGHIYDRFPISGTNNDLFLSAKAILGYDMVVTSSTATSVVAMQFQHSLTTVSSAFVDFADIAGSTNATFTLGPTTVSADRTRSAVLEANLDLSQRNRYVRVQVTHNMSASATDTVDLSCILAFGGGDEDPAS